MTLKKAIKKMVDLYSKGKFEPKQEADIRCMMYHFLLVQGADSQKIHADYPVYLKDGREIHPDLVIGNPRNIAKCVLVQIKFMAREWAKQPGRLDGRIRSSIEDLTKLSKIRCKKKLLLFFNEANPLSDKRRNQLNWAVKKTRASIILIERKWPK